MSASSPSTPPVTRTRRKGERPAELLTAALELFTQKGYSATRAEEIARRAGVSKGTLFLYFSTKEELFEAVVKQTVVPLVQDAKIFAEQFSGSAAQLLSELIARWWQRTGTTSACSMPHLLITEAHHFPHCAAYYEEEVLQPCKKIVCDTVARGIASGEFRPTDPDMVWLSFHSLLIYPSAWHKAIAGNNPAQALLPHTDMGRFIAHHCDLLIHGLRA